MINCNGRSIVYQAVYLHKALRAFLHKYEKALDICICSKYIMIQAHIARLNKHRSRVLSAKNNNFCTTIIDLLITSCVHFFAATCTKRISSNIAIETTPYLKNDYSISISEQIYIMQSRRLGLIHQWFEFIQSVKNYWGRSTYDSVTFPCHISQLELQ